MLKLRILFFFCFIFFSLPLFAQEPVAGKGNDGVPVGMESIQVTGGYRLLVPQGAKIRHIGAQILVEDDKEYFSRRFYEISQEVEDLKNQVKQLQNDITMLKEKTQALEQEKLQQATSASSIVP